MATANAEPGSLGQSFHVCRNFLQKSYQQFLNQRNHQIGETFFFGVSGPQGSGKSTLSLKLKSFLCESGISTVSISIDDFYKTADGLDKLRQRFPDNVLLSTRGVPGTHDLDLARTVIAKLKDRNPVKVPTYDKSARGGRGDRVADKNWIMYNGESDTLIDIVILEGWCWGFQALGPSLKSRVEDLQRKEGSIVSRHRLESLAWIDKQLEGYHTGIFDLVNALLIIKAENIHSVYNWRLEAEHILKQQRGQSMSDNETIDFINNYMPCYELYVSIAPQGVPSLAITINEKRAITKI